MDFERQQFNPQFNPRACFYCGKPGHKAADCFHQFKDMRMASKSMGMNGIPPLRNTIRQVPQHPMQPRFSPRYVQTEQRYEQRSPRLMERIQERPQRPQERLEQQVDVRSYDEFTDALAYMSERRSSMGREDFKTLVCSTELGTKLHECLLDFENQLN